MAGRRYKGRGFGWVCIGMRLPVGGGGLEGSPSLHNFRSSNTGTMALVNNRSCTKSALQTEEHKRALT
eukprot:scaffold287402_cov23-Tisochrysis_lutea.AAC.1